MEHLWTLRLEALRLANPEGRPIDTEELIGRADAIEQYIKHGRVSPEMRQILNEDAIATTKEH